MKTLFDLFKPKSNLETLQTRSKKQEEFSKKKWSLTALLGEKSISSYMFDVALKTQKLLAQKNISARVRIILPKTIVTYDKIKRLGCMLEHPTDDGKSSIQSFICYVTPFDFGPTQDAFFINPDSLAQNIYVRIQQANLWKEIDMGWVDKEFDDWDVVN